VRVARVSGVLGVTQEEQLANAGIRQVDHLNSNDLVTCIKWGSRDEIADQVARMSGVLGMTYRQLRISQYYVPYPGGVKISNIPRL